LPQPIGQFNKHSVFAAEIAYDDPVGVQATIAHSAMAAVKQTHRSAATDLPCKQLPIFTCVVERNKCELI
jgi:hypothetical protein